MIWTTNAAKVMFGQDDRTTITFFSKNKNLTLSKKASATITQLVLMLLVSTIIAFYIQFGSADAMVTLVGMPPILITVSFVILLCMFFNTMKNYNTLPLFMSLLAATVFIIAALLLAGTNSSLQ
jgi:lipopolysaccharide export LptBFGC system permease protein LptF